MVRDKGYEAVWHDLLAKVAAAPTDVVGYPVSIFGGGRGWKYDGELLVVGRAVNGWHEKWTQADILDTATRQARLQAELAYARGDGAECPMSWVVRGWNARKGYKVARSAFFRVTRGLAKGLGMDGDDWSSRLAWSNFYRLSPDAGGNPSDALCDLQKKACIELLRLGVENLKPKRILMSGRGWFNHYVDALGAESRLMSTGASRRSGGSEQRASS